jgi:glycosyltransferase involved in cell wall biosynthesis
MRISVALASYNGQKYIIEQLESIRKQSIPVDEVIINDDCSTDQTVSLIKGFITKYDLVNWKVFINKINLGFSKNFHEAVKQTTGDLIFLADQDDIWFLNKVETIQQNFIINKELKALATGQIFVDTIGRVIGKPKNVNNNENSKLSYLPFEFFIGSSTIPGCTLCFTKELKTFLKKFGAPDLSKSFGHDWYYCVLGAALGRFGLIDDILIKRRIHENNASKVSSRKTRVLSVTTERKKKYLVEIITAHQFILNNESFKNQLSKSDLIKVKHMLRFFKRRLELLNSKNIFIWIGMGFNFFNYYHCSKSLKGAFQLYLADLFYTFNINWNTHNKTK